jgi:hypothetical protein
MAPHALLTRYSQGKTQTVSISFHSVAWKKCSKGKLISKKTHLTVVEAVPEFNKGSYKKEVAKIVQEHTVKCKG